MKNYYFYTVDFMDIYSGQHHFRLIDAPVGLTHEERLAHFDRDINGCWEANNFDPQFTITGYDLDDSDMDDDWMRENDISTMRFKDTYWSSILQGAV